MTALLPRETSVLIERLNEAVEKGILDIIWELHPQPEETVSLTDGELARLMMILFPDEYPARTIGPKPTKAPPGSRRKIAEMQARVAAGLAPCHPHDATMNGFTPIKQPGRRARNDLIKFDEDLIQFDAD